MVCAEQLLASHAPSAFAPPSPITLSAQEDAMRLLRRLSAATSVDSATLITSGLRSALTAAEKAGTPLKVVAAEELAAMEQATLRSFVDGL